MVLSWVWTQTSTVENHKEDPRELAQRKDRGLATEPDSDLPHPKFKKPAKRDNMHL